MIFPQIMSVYELNEEPYLVVNYGFLNRQMIFYCVDGYYLTTVLNANHSWYTFRCNEITRSGSIGELNIHAAGFPNDAFFRYVEHTKVFTMEEMQQAKVIYEITDPSECVDKQRIFSLHRGAQEYVNETSIWYSKDSSREEMVKGTVYKIKTNSKQEKWDYGYFVCMGYIGTAKMSVWGFKVDKNGYIFNMRESHPRSIIPPAKDVDRWMTGGLEQKYPVFEPIKVLNVGEYMEALKYIKVSHLRIPFIIETDK